MANVLSDQFRRGFEHECRAFDLVRDSFETVPADRRGAADYARAISILAHLATARRAWLSRLGKTSPPTLGMFPTGLTLDEVNQQWQEIRAPWQEYLGALADADLEQTITYRSFDGSSYRNSVGEILTQLYGHCHYHRGQVAMLVKNCGGQPAMTDFIFFHRQPVENV